MKKDRKLSMTNVGCEKGLGGKEHEGGYSEGGGRALKTRTNDIGDDIESARFCRIEAILGKKHHDKGCPFTD